MNGEPDGPQAEFNGQQGLVPANYCQIETASPSPQPVAAAPPSGGSKQQRGATRFRRFNAV